MSPRRYSSDRSTKSISGSEKRFSTDWKPVCNKKYIFEIPNVEYAQKSTDVQHDGKYRRISTLFDLRPVENPVQTVENPENQEPFQQTLWHSLFKTLPKPRIFRRSSNLSL